jgi:hypothetical protein
MNPEGWRALRIHFQMVNVLENLTSSIWLPIVLKAETFDSFHEVILPHPLDECLGCFHLL